MLLAVVLLALHSFGEALHFRAHLPPRTSHLSAHSASAAIRAAANVACADDDCAFCALIATAARQSASPIPAIVVPAALDAPRVFAPSFAFIIPSCRPRAPGPPRAPPVFFA